MPSKQPVEQAPNIADIGALKHLSVVLSSRNRVGQPALKQRRHFKIVVSHQQDVEQAPNIANIGALKHLSIVLSSSNLVGMSGF